jgi:hypothetical protein
METLVRLTVLAAAAAALASPAWASDPIGVYALIESVSQEPDDKTPERVLIRGVFAFAEGRGDTYAPAKRGYLYYQLTPGKEDVARKEWSDLRAVAATGQAIGFGQRYQAKGRLRAAGEKPEAPDVYPLGFGLVKVLSRHLGPQIEKELKSVPAEK